MGEWIARYWLEVLFGIVLAVLAWGGKRLVKFYIQQLHDSLDDVKTEIMKYVKEHNDMQDKSLEDLRAGLLSMQRPVFKERCHNLLASDHKITVDEMERITKDHEAYKGLGGNHEGDTLFELVVEKAKKDIT